MLKNSVFKFVVFALWSVLFAAVPAAEDPDVETTALEAKIRQELSLLRSRLLELETLLDLLQTGSGAAEVEPVQDSGKAAVSEAVSPTPKPVVSGLRDQELSSGVVSSGGQAISFTGLLDAYFTHNTNSPPDGYNMLYYTNPNARGFGLNQAKIEIDASGNGPIGFRSDIWFGSGARLFRDGLEPGPLEDVLYLQQAYGYYQSSSGARLDVGLFGTIAGLEVPESHLNWNYSRGTPVGSQRALLAPWRSAQYTDDGHVYVDRHVRQRLRQRLGSKYRQVVWSTGFLRAKRQLQHDLDLD